MKLLGKAPDYKKLLNSVAQEDREKLLRIMSNTKTTDQKGRYLYWDKLKYAKNLPEGCQTHEEWWLGMKLARNVARKELPFIDKNHQPFFFNTPDPALKDLHWIDQHTNKTIAINSEVTNQHTKDAYLIQSLMNEAIHSSQLEGATTTRAIAKDMLIREREPKDKHEKMILNNYSAMQFIQENKDEELTPNLILDLHKVVTDGTLDGGQAGRYRTNADNITVMDATTSEVLHSPPDANELEVRMQQLCDFANEEQEYFIHPVVKAILLHFMLAYDHPFVDGNGRTARALFYFFMSQQGYWLIEYISISKIIKNSVSKYGKAFLHTEHDDNDATYFIIHQLEVIKKGVDDFYQYLGEKTQGIQRTEELLSHNKNLQGKLNTRQLSLLHHALKHPNYIYEVKSHQSYHNIVYQTARTDLLGMSDLGLFSKIKIGKSFGFVAGKDLDKKI
jgi:Fic family protein